MLQPVKIRRLCLPTYEYSVQRLVEALNYYQDKLYARILHLDPDN